MFLDTAKIFIKSGKGGDGHVSFRREKFVPDGGPDGGDGGRGGDIVFEVDKGLSTLNDYRYSHKFCAQNGADGGGKRCNGKDGLDLILKVPEGTVVREETTGKVVADMSRDNLRQVVLTGGRGGKGNMHYATSTMQAPKYAQPGQAARELNVILELKVIADVGLVGFPNAGKSTLLSHVSNAQPKVADYPFTTLNPILGVVEKGVHRPFVIADIPGLIEGASEGVGLGIKFLKHIERTRLLIHMVDAASPDEMPPVEAIEKIRTELSAYSEDLIKKPFVIAVNKLDALLEEDREAVLEDVRKHFEGREVFGISAVSGEGLQTLMSRISAILEEMGDDVITYEPDFVYEEDSAAGLPFTVSYDQEEKVYLVEGPRIERMLGYTNLSSEKGFDFFQKFLKENEILKELEELGIKDGDTVRIYGWDFDYYK
ncbi:MAG: GTPase ObgE [Lachnospiraceae bacterium]|nr:GTPase ObgE [Lachnospiraceae bacterium]MBQ6090273.1 GTPase ObgE [Lachnospiraceae bacterium]MBR5368484.1 GTPase ObgE [Lachnospiraceae bacterium]